MLFVLLYMYNVHTLSACTYIHAYIHINASNNQPTNQTNKQPNRFIKNLSFLQIDLY